MGMANPSAVPPQVADLSAALAQPRPMRRGSVNERIMKCGQANCTQAAGGKTRSRYVAAEQVPALRGQIEAGREFRQQVEAYWDACEQWADAELEQAPAAEAAEKKGSRRASGKR